MNPGFQWSLTQCIKVNDLSAGMNTCIGSSCTTHSNRMSGNSRYRLLKSFLYCGEGRIELGLPAMEGTAIIFDTECQPGGHGNLLNPVG